MRRIDGKFHIEGEKVIHVSGREVPEDEPLFLFRARDRYAVSVLTTYRKTCQDAGCTEYQIAGIQAAINAFLKFREEHPERMKEPGITMGAREVI